jgi:hypothetical protein
MPARTLSVSRSERPAAARPTWPRYVPTLILGAAFAWLVAWTWGKWPDLVVDFGRQLYVPWRLSEGEVLYRDLAYIMGPASQYFNALLFELFGVSLLTLVVANLVLLAAILFLLQRILARIGSTTTRVVLGLFFLCVFAFAQYVGNGVYNYVCPYRHEMTHGMAAVLLLVASLLAWSDRPRAWLMLVAGGCVGLTAMLKTEMFVAAAGTAVLGIAFAAAARRVDGRFTSRIVIPFLAGAGVPIAALWACLAAALGAGPGLAAAFTNWNLTLTPGLYGANPFYLATSGLDAPAGNLAKMLAALLVWTILVAALAGLDRAAAGIERGRRVLVPAVGVIVFLLGWFLVPPSLVFAGARPLPLVAAGVLAAVGVAAWRRRDDPETLRRLLPWALWSGLSALLLLKTVLAARISFYGFVLAVPATLLLGLLLLDTLPAVLKRRDGRGDLFRAAAVGLLAAWSAICLQTSHDFYRGKVLTIGEGGDRFLHDARFNARNALLPRVLRHLDAELPPDATLTVLPEGGMFNYLLRRRNPTPYYLLTPWELEAFGGEAVVLERIRAAPPDYILLLSIDMAEYGKRLFGDPGYGDTITAWIDGEYERIESFHVRKPSGFQALLLRRRGPA